MWEYHGYGMGAGDWIVMALFVLVLVALVVFVVMRLGAPRVDSGVHRVETPGARPPGEDPVEILRRRLARGEIDVETYDQLRAKLDAEPPAGER